ncbi:type II CAAX prenyl endopeptidase Rce1 family protein [Pedobacter frigiditerrae]|uniref:CPBP family glutamic-type intramembrane protease n=1 Tax=Pedobacter frigiditerrae TaxID=2530452 RepID=UPI0039774A08
MGIIIAPIMETLIFQFGVIETVKKKKSTLISCILSALFFAIFHCYNFYYFLFAFSAGLLFSYLYCIGKTPLKGFLLTLSAHILYNTFVMFVVYF